MSYPHWVSQTSKVYEPWTLANTILLPVMMAGAHPDLPGPPKYMRLLEQDGEVSDGPTCP